MIVKSDALVLKTMKYGDTSRIITAYTRESGKMSFMAKGARGKKSKFGSALEPLSNSHLVYYYKVDRDLQLLSQADLVVQYRSVIEDEKKLMCGFAMLEFLNAVTMAEDPHPELFELTAASLKEMNDNITNGAGQTIRFLVNLSDNLGFALNFYQCIRCGMKLDAELFVKRRAQFEPHDGGFYCASCSKDGLFHTIGGETLRVFQASNEIAEGNGQSFTKLTFNESLELLSYHLATHIEGMRRIRTLALIHPFD